MFPMTPTMKTMAKLKTKETLWSLMDLAMQCSCFQVTFVSMSEEVHLKEFRQCSFSGYVMNLWRESQRYCGGSTDWPWWRFCSGNVWGGSEGKQDQRLNPHVDPPASICKKQDLIFLTIQNLPRLSINFRLRPGTELPINFPICAIFLPSNHPSNRDCWSHW